MADKPNKPNPPKAPEVVEEDGRTGDSSTQTERDAARTGEFDKLEREVREGQ